RQNPFAKGVEQRYLHDASPARPLAPIERHQDAAERVHAGRDISYRDSCLAWRLRRSRDRNETCLELYQEVVSFLIFVGAIRSVAAYLAYDQSGIPGQHGLAFQAGAVCGSGRQIVYEDVAVRGEFLHDLCGFRPFKVQSKALLRAIQPDEPARQPAYFVVVITREVPVFAALDLYDSSAKVC